MEARLYELIRDYQKQRAETIGGNLPEFRERLLREFAAARVDRFPEYSLEDGRLSRVIAQALASGEILALGGSHRDPMLVLRWDHEAAS